MQNILTSYLNKSKHILYLISMGILLFLTIIIFTQATFNFSEMDFLKNIMAPFSLSLLAICGAVLLICFFLFIGRILSALSNRDQILLTILLGTICITIQYFLLFYLQPVLRYDHLRVFDGALEIIQTGRLSLTANESYFGHYPFNIPVTIFNSIFLRIFMAFGVAEKYYMLSLQCVYLFLIDLGIFFSWNIVRILHSVKNATLFALLCFFNPVLYVCAAGCYTTTLMIPLLMSTLLLAVYFLKEQHLVKKIIFGFAFGFVLIFGSMIRATILIAGIALVIYLLIRVRTDTKILFTRKQVCIQAAAMILGCILAFGGWTFMEHRYVIEDSTNSQMPLLYYLMFAANPETKGSYNEDDYQMISKYDTLEEKNKISFQILKERIKAMGTSGVLSLAKHKLGLTWSDGTEDYGDFLTTSRNYSPLQSYIGGDHGDFFALCCHIYHIAMMGMFLIAVIFALKRTCDSSYYLIFLTLLGGMIFHIFWESYYIYSFGFSMLLYIPSSESICRLSEKHWVTHKIWGLGFLSFTLFVLTFLPNAKGICQTEYKHKEYAVVQDMKIGEHQPLLFGETVTQTFQTDLPFNRVGCKVSNKTGNENDSLYRMEVLTENGSVLVSREFYGSEVLDQDYCYVEVPPQIPEGKQTYTIRITALKTSAKHSLTFYYYNTHHYDIYADGFMTGLDSDSKSDLTFVVFNRVIKSFFH